MEVTQFIANKEDRSFFDSLVENLKKCSEFKMSVAFFSWGGIQNFFPLFEELQQRNVKGQILISGKLELLEHENAAWLTKDNLMSVNWLPADVTILDKVLMLL